VSRMGGLEDREKRFLKKVVAAGLKGAKLVGL
jgi:hypothetical protein